MLHTLQRHGACVVVLLEHTERWSEVQMSATGQITVAVREMHMGDDGQVGGEAGSRIGFLKVHVEEIGHEADMGVVHRPDHRRALRQGAEEVCLVAIEGFQDKGHPVIRSDTTELREYLQPEGFRQLVRRTPRGEVGEAERAEDRHNHDHLHSQPRRQPADPAQVLLFSLSGSGFRRQEVTHAATHGRSGNASLCHGVPEFLQMGLCTLWEKLNAIVALRTEETQLLPVMRRRDHVLRDCEAHGVRRLPLSPVSRALVFQWELLSPRPRSARGRARVTVAHCIVAQACRVTVRTREKGYRMALTIDLSDKVAVVTGAARGIGRGIALALAEAGASVAVHYNESEQFVDSVCETVRGYGRQAVPVRADLRDPQSGARIVEQAYASFGRIDILVNNAAVFKVTPALELTQEEWDWLHAINLRTPFFLCQAAGRCMLAQGRGVLVNIASGGGLSVYPGYETAAHYASAKAGLVMLTRRLAREWAPTVRVNCVTPGIVDSKPEPMPAREREENARRIPLRRVGRIEDIARVVTFLCSDGAAYMTGQVVNVDGGLVMW